MTLVTDPYGRRLEGLRVSVNAECNFDCVFCHMEGIDKNEKLLRPEDYKLIAVAFKQLGGEEVKVTGGEPLLRPDIVEIVKSFTGEGLKTSMTTNGFLLPRYAWGLKEAGIHHVNISLHSMDPVLFKRLTGGDLERVLKGIRTAIEAGVRVKLNYVALRENEGELPRVIEYAGKIGADINIIQLMPIFIQTENGQRKVRINLTRWRKLDSSIERVEKYLAEKALRVGRKKPHNRRVYYLPQGVRATVIRGYDNPFACYNCTRIRITPDAKVKTCLYSENPYVDLKPALDSGDITRVKLLLARAVSLRRPRFPPPSITSIQPPGAGRR